MTHSKRSPHRKHPVSPHALRKEVLEFLSEQGGTTKHTAVFTHFGWDPVETVRDTIDELFEEKLIDEQWDGVLLLTDRGKKALDRLHRLEKH